MGTEALPGDEQITITLTFAQWVKVAAGLTATYGPGEDLINTIRDAVAKGN
jgi:hypothetical protein